MQRFNVDNVESRFIKNLLLNTYLPSFPIACAGDFIVADVMYTFGNSIIKCTGSGVLLDSNNEYENVKFVNQNGRQSPACSDLIVCGADIICGVGIRTAKYTTVSNFTTNKQISGVTSNFISHSTTYGAEIHKNLGKYLRWYKSAYDVDLMPLYNCFTNTETTHFHLNADSEDNKFIVDGNNPDVITWTIPALPNKNYQIYINEPSRIFVGGVYLNELGRIKCNYDDKEYLDELLSTKPIAVEGSSYSRPIEFRVSTTDPTLLNYSNNFYIALQTPKNHTTSIVVIENDVLKHTAPVTSGEIFIDRDKGLWPDVGYHRFNPPIKSSLTTIPTSFNIPYSDRLIEYLLNNVIDTQEDISMNIYRLQKELGVLGKYNLDKDVWSPLMKFLLYNKYFEHHSNFSVDKNYPTEKDLEGIPSSKYVLDMNNQVVGLKNIQYKPSTGSDVDILGFCDRDVENSLFRYKGV